MLATEHEIQRSQVVSQAAAAPFTAAREAAETAAGRLVQVVGQANRDLGRDGSTAEVVTCFLGRWAGYWRLDQIAWVSIEEDKLGRVLGISGTASIDPTSPLSEVLLEATQALLAGQVTRAHWSSPVLRRPPHMSTDAPAVPEVPRAIATRLQNVAREFSVPAVLALPIRDQDRVLAWFFLLGEPAITRKPWQESQSAAWEILSSQVALGRRVQQSAWSRLTQRPCRWLRMWRWWLLASSLGLLVLAAWPSAYTMHCVCELATTDRRYAVAPYPGVLKDVFVRPGERVLAGDLLATMEDRELRIELAGKSAAHERELNQVRLARASGDTSQARIAELETARIAQELALLEGQLANREIRAPIPGTVVQGDLVELKGAPVEIGQNLFEIAALDQLIVQIEIPEHQYRYSQVGQAVRVRLEAFPHEDLSGLIERLLPRAFPRDQRNVFLAEVLVANPHGHLRPGMKGQAKIVGESYPLAWKWLHYPYEKSRTLLGWY